MSHWIVVRPRQMPISFRVQRQVPLVLLLLTVITLAIVILSASYGEYPISPLDVLKTLLGIETGNPDHAFVIYTLRLPRALVALLAGIGLAIPGAILQGLTRNPLAAPDVIGINAGASMAAVSLIVLFPAAPLFAIPLSAFAGAAIAATLIYLLAWDRGSSPIRFILIGVGIAAVASAITSVLMAFGQINNVTQALIWMTGSVYGRSWEHILLLLPWLGIFVPLALLLSRELNVLHLGDDVARGLGSNVEWQRFLLLLTSVALTGASVATAGTIGFVGLMAPHLARQLVGTASEGLLPTTALLGGLITVLADLLGRSLFSPTELPCGVLTALVGAPYFLYLLYQNRHQ
ncbi:iron ABC transporter permease [Phormidium sp. FACHB-592]|uniref:Iron ABC transporter permease n=1 Tax=Stenomitos frigidus AS-A4 TaxID=2933935 RepID=A0ABV0KHA7_9CYAN|nr:iron ABC transporter permease [Phormidium sp. FACHB-592]MBD2073529.1 iron ABC transporter permease [Phormidium sp. FACHB-592]